MVAWLERILQCGGWTRYVSEPRYQLVVLRELVARARARREQRAFHGKERACRTSSFPNSRTQAMAPSSRWWDR